MKKNKPTNRPTALGIGLIALDVVSGGREHVDNAGLYAGGTCGNVMSLLAFFGWTAQPVGRLDDDAAGTIVRADLKRFGVDLRHIGLEPTARTPIVMQRIIHDDGRARHVFTWSCAECGARFPGYQPVTLPAINTLISGAPIPTVLFCDRASPSAVRLAEHCRMNGSLVVFEAAGIGSPTHFRRMLELAHILKYSHETQKAVDLLRTENPDTALLEIETLGAGGLRYRLRTGNEKRWNERSAFTPPRLSDSAGSGDWSTAGLLDRLCRDGVTGLESATDTELVAALDHAQSLSAWNCAFEGARGGMYGMTATRVLGVARQIRENTRCAKVPERATSSVSRGDFCGICSQQPRLQRGTTKASPKASRRRVLPGYQVIERK